MKPGVAHMWEEIKKVELVHVVVVVVGALGTATDNIQKWLGKNGLLIRTEMLSEDNSAWDKQNSEQVLVSVEG